MLLSRIFLVLHPSLRHSRPSEFPWVVFHSIFISYWSDCVTSHLLFPQASRLWHSDSSCVLVPTSDCFLQIPLSDWLKWFSCFLFFFFQPSCLTRDCRIRLMLTYTLCYQFVWTAECTPKRPYIWILDPTFLNNFNCWVQCVLLIDF